MILTKPQNQFLVVLVLIGLSSLISFSFFTQDQGWGDDFAAYIMQAQSLADGTVENYIQDLTFMMQRSSPSPIPAPWPFIGPVLAPWGFPLFLVPIYHAAGVNFLAFKQINIIFFSLTLILIFYLFRTRLGPQVMLLVAILAFNPNLLFAQENILSDILFLFLSTGSLLLMDRWLKQESQISVYSNMFLGLVLFIANAIRPNGILLCIAFGMCQIIWYFEHSRPNFRQFRFIWVPYGVFVLLWMMWLWVLPSIPESYISYLWPLRIREMAINAKYYFELMPTFFFPVPFAQWIYVVSLPFLGIGLVSRIRKDYLFIVYSGLTLVFYLFLSSGQGLRYLFPIIPFYMYFVFAGFSDTCRLVSKRLQFMSRMLALIVCFVILASFLMYSLEFVIRNLQNGRPTGEIYAPSSMEMFNYISQNSRQDDVIVFFKPRVMRLMTHRRTIVANRCAELGQGDYIVFYQNASSYLQVPFNSLDSCGLGLTKVFGNSRFTIFTNQHQ
jgi:hypothetical protein